jgi:hypothetical protein
VHWTARPSPTLALARHVLFGSSRPFEVRECAVPSAFSFNKRHLSLVILAMVCALGATFFYVCAGAATFCGDAPRCFENLTHEDRAYSCRRRQRRLVGTAEACRKKEKVPSHNMSWEGDRALHCDPVRLVLSATCIVPQLLCCLVMYCGHTPMAHRPLIVLKYRKDGGFSQGCLDALPLTQSSSSLFICHLFILASPILFRLP